MLTTTTRFIRFVAGLLVALSLGFEGLAQAVPSWQSVRGVGVGAMGRYPTSPGVVDAAGNLYEAGTFYQTMTLGGTTLTSGSGIHGYVAKYKTDGTLAWIKQIGSGVSLERVDLKAVTVDRTGNVYVAGNFSRSINLGNDVTLTGDSQYTQLGFMVRYSPQGTPEWAQQTTTYASTSDIATDDNGHVYFTGLFNDRVTIESTTVTSPRTNNTFIARLSAATGALESLVPTFYYLLPVPAGPGVYEHTDLAVTPDGRMYLTVDFYRPAVFSPSLTLTPGPKGDALVACYNPRGTLEWVRQFGGTSEERVNDAVADAAGNVYVVGNISPSPSFDNVTLPGGGNFLVKYSPQGVVQWARGNEAPDLMGGGSWAGVALDEAGAPYVTGVFTGSVLLGSTKLTSQGTSDVMVAAYSPQGECRWAASGGGPTSDWGSIVGAVGNTVYLLGHLSATATFGALTASASMAPWGTDSNYETFVARLGTGVLATQAPKARSIAVYPNPATAQVQLTGLPSGSRIEVVDALGRLARTAVLPADASLSVVGLAPGLYSVRATDAQGQPYVSRLVVQ